MKRKCGYRHSDVRLYIQNRMSIDEETAFQHHLLNCEACAEELARLRRMVHSIGRKERRIIPFRIWMLAASVACVLMGGGAYYYFSTQSAGIMQPEGSDGLKLNPPAFRNDRDSIAPGDTLRIDTISVEVVPSDVRQLHR